MALVWSRKRLWVLGGVGFLAFALATIFLGLFRAKPMITDARVREIFAGEGSPMTVDEFFAWVDWMRQKRPMSLEETEKLLGIRFRRLTLKEEFLLSEGPEALARQGPGYEEYLASREKDAENGIAEFASGPWKQLKFGRNKCPDCHAFLRFLIRPEIIRISKGDMVRHLGIPRAQWNPPVENIYATGSERFPEGLTPKLYWWAYQRPRDETTFFFDDHSADDVLHDELALHSGEFELRPKPEEKNW